MPVKGLDKFQRKALALQKAMGRRIPVLIQTAAVKHFRANFKAQGFVNNGAQPWKRRAKDPVRKDRKATPKILIGRTAMLINSIRPGAANWNRIEIVAGGQQAPYAKIHNEGGDIRGTHNVRKHTRRRKRGGDSEVRAHSRTMNTTIPKRQFMGDSAELRMKAKGIILSEVIKIMKP
jgi:phage gpG-like protein